MYWPGPWMCPKYSEEYISLVEDLELAMHRGSVGVFPNLIFFFFLLFLRKTQGIIDIEAYLLPS